MYLIFGNAWISQKNSHKMFLKINKIDIQSINISTGRLALPWGDPTLDGGLLVNLSLKFGQILPRLLSYHFVVHEAFDVLHRHPWVIAGQSRTITLVS